jgi:hypothetical protein
MADEDKAMLSDSDLQRMLKNLKLAFSDACSEYESKRHSVEYGYGSRVDRDAAATQFAKVSEAYLQASAEQRRRNEEKAVTSDLGKSQALKLAQPGK